MKRLLVIVMTTFALSACPEERSFRYVFGLQYNTATAPCELELRWREGDAEQTVACDALAGGAFERGGIFSDGSGPKSCEPAELAPYVGSDGASPPPLPAQCSIGDVDADAADAEVADTADVGPSDVVAEAVDVASDLEGDGDVELPDGQHDLPVDASDGDAGNEVDTPDDGGSVVLVPPVLRYPFNGFFTGSALVTEPTAVQQHPLRPQVMWEAVENATSYQVQFDDCTPFCDFAEPVLDQETAGQPAPSGDALVFRPDAPLLVPTTAPVGLRHVWRVRGCTSAGCGPWSDSRYLEVGQQSTDFDGDGFADVAVATPDTYNPNPNGGNVFIYPGAAAGPPDTPSTTLGPPNAQTGGGFSNAVAGLGDVNGDGFADLAVAAESYDEPAQNAGRVFVYFGSDTGLPDTPEITLGWSGHAAGDFFGSAVSGAGDVNGDGYADVVVGAPSSAAQKGNVFVYYGSESGPPETEDVVLVDPDPKDQGRFGRAVTGGDDINGDGFADVVVSTATAEVYVYLGGLAGIETTPSATLTGFSGYGLALTLGDTSSDGFADVAVTDLGDGIYVYPGAAAGPTASSFAFLTAPPSTAGLGYEISARADLNDDGFADLVVGSSDSTGKLYVFLGTAIGLSATASPTLSLPAAQHSVSSGDDVNGDGFPDAAIGVFDSTPTLQILKGGSSWPPTAPSIVIDAPVGAGPAFGWSVSKAL